METEIKICVYYRLRLQSSSCGRSLKPRALKYQEHETWHSLTRHVLISDTLSVEQFHEITYFTHLIDTFAQCVKQRTDALWISLHNA